MSFVNTIIRSYWEVAQKGEKKNTKKHSRISCPIYKQSTRPQRTTLIIGLRCMSFLLLSLYVLETLLCNLLVANEDLFIQPKKKKRKKERKLDHKEEI
jgi:hypothetical protein